MDTPTVALLTTGDELLLGEILNSNSQQIALTLLELGFYINLMVTCGDAEAEIYPAIENCLQDHDILIMTGGLGPTEDDRTRFALNQYLNSTLIFDENSWEYICQRLARLNIEPHENSRQQAMFPKEATIFHNPLGSANGCVCYHGDKIIFMLPGPPRECLPMLITSVLPILQNKFPTRKKSLMKWRVFGVVESWLAHELQMALNHRVELAYRWHFPYIDIKWVYHENEFDAEIPAIIERVIAPFRFESLDHLATEQLAILLGQSTIRLNIIDELTYGLLASHLVKPATKNRIRFITENNVEAGAFTLQLTGLTSYWENGEDAEQNMQMKIITPEGKVSMFEKSIHTLTGAERQYAAEWVSIQLLAFFKEFL